jgi:hypothetical protein
VHAGEEDMTVKAACSEFREALPGTSGVPSVSSNAVAQFLQTLFAVFERNTPQNIQVTIVATEVSYH